MTAAVRRRVVNGIKDLAPGVSVVVLRQRKHCVLEISRPGAPARHITISVSPRDVDYAVANAVREARAALGLP